MANATYPRSTRDASRSRQQIEALLARVAAIESAGAGPDSRRAQEAFPAGPDALGGMGLRPRSRRPDRLAHVVARGERDTRRRRACSSTARRATRFRHHCRASSKPRRSRSGCGSTISSSAAAGRSSIQTRDGARLRRDRLRRAGSRHLDGGQRRFSPVPERRAASRERRDEARRSTWRSPTPTTARSASSATAGPTGRLTRSSARSAFPAAKPRSSLVCGTRRPAATGCWPGRLCGPGVRPGTRRGGGRRLGRHVSATTSIPAAIAAALTPECRAERTRLMERDREASVIASPVAPARHTPSSPREAGAMRRADPGESQPARRRGRGRRRRGDRRARGRLSACRPMHPRPDRRERLASWISSPQNPLFARVVVNRLWQAHFGTGLVETSSDLGFNGGTPSHPELLDWLASEMVAQRLEPQVDAPADRHVGRLSSVVALGPEAARARRRRPLALAQGPDATRGRDGSRRDAAVSGILDPRLGGPSFRDQEIVKAPGTPADPVRGGRSQDAGAQPADAFPRLGSRRPKPVARRVRLPRSIDDRAPARRHDHAAPGPLIDEQCPGALSVRRLRRTAGARGRARRRPAGRARLPAGVRALAPSPTSERGPCAWSSDSGPPTLARAIFNSNEFLYLD